MNAFDRALAFVLDYEGGYSHDPADKGGETNRGISKRAYPHEDIAGMTVARAGEIYKRDYWRPLSCDDFAYPLAVALFDTGINCGVGTAIRLAQRAAGVPEDGILGPVTRTALALSPRTMQAKLLARRCVHYASLPTVGHFGLGWFTRVLACAGQT